MDGMDELRSPSLPTSPVASIIVFPSPSTLSSSSFSGQYGVQRNRGQLTAAKLNGSKVYAISLSKKSWLAAETGVEGAEIGGLFKISRWGRSITELAAGQLVLPGGVSISRQGKALVAGPVFGPGQLLRIG